MRIQLKFFLITFSFFTLICLANSNYLTNKSTATTTSSRNESILNNKYLSKIDSVVYNSINQHVFPGCQIVILKNGQQIFQKSYGYYTYDNIQKVSDSTLYDLASLSKTTGTLLAVMKLYDEGKLQLDDKISKYLNFTKGTDKADITISELLFHESGLIGSMFFYQNLIEKKTEIDNEKNAATLNSSKYRYKKGWTSKFKTSTYNLQAGDSLFLNNSFHEYAMKNIANSHLGPKSYLYSCVNFILLKEIVEEITCISMDKYLDSIFYKPMKLNNIAYLPLQFFDKNQIAPTIKKDYLRNEMLQGFVHDPDAAFLGGISGNAGLFANAADVAIVYQMLLNNGSLNGKYFFSKQTCELFTKTTSTSGRRGLGFDKSLPSEPEKNPCCELAPSEVFGHTGYTGTCCWADPKNNLVFVFLSNRTYPDDNTNKLARQSIRPKIQEIIYKAFKENQNE